MSKSIMQSAKECYLCRKDARLLGYLGGLPSDGLHRHHVMFGTANRQQSERYGLWVWLCVKHHNEDRGLYAVHFNKEVNIQLRMDAERIFLQTHSFSEWMDVFKVNYLDTDEIKRITTKRESPSREDNSVTMGDKTISEAKNGLKTEPPSGFWFIE